MRVLRVSDHRVMPWKNGGGSTTEIAVFPDGAGLDAFDWRVSKATVSTDGPFSTFPDIDRTLAVLSGSGIVLDVDDGREPVRLTAADEPLAFPGDVATYGTLIDGPIVDLNVMSRRGRVVHHIVRHVSAHALDIALTGDVNLIIARENVTLTWDGAKTRLAIDDAVLIGGSGKVVTIAPHADQRMTVFAIAFSPVATT
jgi:environmental stress-induced protein Ves